MIKFYFFIYYEIMSLTKIHELRPGCFRDAIHVYLFHGTQLTCFHSGMSDRTVRYKTSGVIFNGDATVCKCIPYIFRSRA